MHKRVVEEFNKLEGHRLAEKIRWAATFTRGEVSREEFIATLVAIGVNPTTAKVQYRQAEIEDTEIEALLEA